MQLTHFNYLKPCAFQAHGGQTSSGGLRGRGASRLFSHRHHEHRPEGLRRSCTAAAYVASDPSGHLRVEVSLFRLSSLVSRLSSLVRMSLKDAFDTVFNSLL